MATPSIARGATPSPLPGLPGWHDRRGEDPEFLDLELTHFFLLDSRYVGRRTNQATHDGAQFALQMRLGDAAQLAKATFLGKDQSKSIFRSRPRDASCQTLKL
jgi:hypothetical protein